MKSRLPHALCFAAVTLFCTGTILAGEHTSKGASYRLQGKYYDTCACAISCSCGANVSLPTEGHCDGVVLIHIDKGNVGAVQLDGLNFALVLRTPQDQKVGDAFLLKGETDLLTLYLDDRASPVQKQAMPQLLTGLLGTKQIKGYRPPQWAPMKLEVDGDLAKFEIAGGTKLSFEIENTNLDKVLPGLPRSDPGKRITLTNVAPFPWIKEVTQGHSTFFHYDDLGVKWDYKNRNAFFGKVAVSGTVPAPAAEK